VVAVNWWNMFAAGFDTRLVTMEVVATSPQATDMNSIR